MEGMLTRRNSATSQLLHHVHREYRSKLVSPLEDDTLAPEICISTKPEALNCTSLHRIPELSEVLVIVQESYHLKGRCNRSFLQTITWLAVPGSFLKGYYCLWKLETPQNPKP